MSGTPEPADSVDLFPPLPPAGQFTDMIDLVFDIISAERVTASLEPQAKHHQPYGIVHGGVYAAIVESLASYGAGVVAWQMGKAVVGVSNTTDFIRAHRTGRLEAEGTPVHVGRTQQIWQVVITRASDGKVVARGQVRLHNVDPEALGGS